MKWTTLFKSIFIVFIALNIGVLFLIPSIERMPISVGVEEQVMGRPNELSEKNQGEFVEHFLVKRSWFQDHHGFVFSSISLAIMLGAFLLMRNVIDIAGFLSNLKLFSISSQAFTVTPLAIKSKMLTITLYDESDYRLLVFISALSFLCLFAALIFYQIGKNYRVDFDERVLVNSAIRRRSKLYKCSLFFNMIGCSTIIFYVSEIIYFII